METMPFHFDVVGSFLRPAQLKEARQAFASGQIDQTALTEVEDTCIRTLIDQERAVGLQAVTDGEFRRKWWHLDFIAGLEGISTYDRVVAAFGGDTRTMSFSTVSGPLGFATSHPFIEHFRRTSAIAGDTMVKQTIPGPGMIYLDAMVLSESYRQAPIYADEDAFAEALVQTYRDAIQGFYDAGCRYLQLDDTSWGALFSDRFRTRIEAAGYNPDVLIDRFADVTEAALVDKPADMAITTHMCKGNFMSRWLYEGSYERIARRLLGIEGFDGFFLEYDDERSGSFEPLQYLKNQRIVLGLVTTKSGEMEDRDTILRRLEAATAYVPLARICISPQCGFASTEEGNTLAEASQWAKLRLLKSIADEVWGAS